MGRHPLLNQVDFCLDEISFRRDCLARFVSSSSMLMCHIYGHLGWDNFSNFGATLLGFGNEVLLRKEEISLC